MKELDKKKLNVSHDSHCVPMFQMIFLKFKSLLDRRSKQRINFHYFLTEATTN